MIRPNLSAKDYWFRCELESPGMVREDLEGLSAFTTIHIRYGVPFILNTSGIALSVKNRTDYGDPLVYHELILETFWGNFTLISEEDWLDVAKAKVFIEDVTLTVTDCTDYVFSFSSFKVFYDDILVYSTGSKTTNGVGWELKYCPMKAICDSPVNPAWLPELPDCSGLNTLTHVQATGTVGYKVGPAGGSTVAENVHLDLSPTPPTPLPVDGCSLCSCEWPLPSITLIPDEGSWGVKLGADEDLRCELSPFETVQCSCTCHVNGNDIPCGIPAIYSCNRERITKLRRTSMVEVAPTNAGLLSHTKETGSKCWCCGVPEPEFYNVIGPNTSDENITSIAFYRDVKRFDGTIGCCTLIQAGVCPTGDPEDPPTPPPNFCNYHTDYCCIYKAYQQMSWMSPSCGCENPDIHCYINGDTYAACVYDGDIYVNYKSHPNKLSWEHSSQATTGNNSSYPCITVTPKNTVVLAYQSNLGTYRTYSFDDGKTWSNAILTISGGKYPRVACHINGDIVHAAWVDASGDGGRIKSIFNSGGNNTFGPVTWLDEAGDEIIVADQAFGMDWSYTQGNLLLATFVVQGESTASVWFSTDDSKTWTRLP